MKVKELIALLELVDEDAEVCLYDNKTDDYVTAKAVYKSTAWNQILISQIDQAPKED